MRIADNSSRICESSFEELAGAAVPSTAQSARMRLSSACRRCSGPAISVVSNYRITEIVEEMNVYWPLAAGENIDKKQNKYYSFYACTLKIADYLIKLVWSQANAPKECCGLAVHGPASRGMYQQRGAVGG